MGGTDPLMDRGIPLRKESSESKLPAKLLQSISPKAHLMISCTKRMQKKGQFWSQKTCGCEIMHVSRKRSSYKNVQSPICCSLIKITAQTADKKVLRIYWPWEQERGKVRFENICNFTSEKSFSVSNAHQQEVSAELCSVWPLDELGISAVVSA